MTPGSRATLQRVALEGRPYDDEGLPPGVTTFAT
jgi:hypothetical protein